jgi:hypothetical protein
MIMKYRIVFLALVLAVPAMVSAQVSADLTIANEYLSNDTCYFDIYLATRPGSNDLYLSTGDFIMTFNVANFTGPAITKGPSSTFTLTSGDASNVGSAYNLATAVAIVGSEIRINLNLINFGGDQNGFNAAVAKITGATNTFRFGTYGISGITNASGSMGLQWKTGGGGSVTKVFSYASSTPWTSVQIDTANAVNPVDLPLPITLSAFSATSRTDGGVTVRWTTLSETHNYGFEVQRSSNATSGFVTLPGSFIPGNGTTVEKHEYSYTDPTAAGGTLYYRLRQIDLDKTEHFSDPISISSVTGVEGQGSLPTEFALRQNYPNPFNPTTTIEFALPLTSRVTIKLYNVLGQQMATIVDEVLPAGFHQIPFNASSLASGMYLYRMTAADKTFLRKMTLLK